MSINALHIHFYKHEVKLLNFVTCIVIIINAIEYFESTSDFYRLLWSGVCIASTIFIDCCTQNVFKELNQKKIATFIIGAIIAGDVVIIVSLFM